MDKPREFLVLIMDGTYNGRAFTYPHTLLDRDWLPGWKRKHQRQIHCIEKSAYDKAVEALKEYAEATDIPTSIPGETVDVAGTAILTLKELGEL